MRVKLKPVDLQHSLLNDAGSFQFNKSRKQKEDRATIGGGIKLFAAFLLFLMELFCKNAQEGKEKA